MIKVQYHYTTRSNQVVITDLTAMGHAMGSDTNMLNVRICAGVSAVLVGSKMCFDCTHTVIIDKRGLFEIHIGKFADKNDYRVMEVLVQQLLTILTNYGSLFMTIEAKEDKNV